jgi:hypothetical protein
VAVIALTSAKGAPGVTTTSLALAMAWPRPTLLVEADMAGSSSILAGYLRGLIPHHRGLIDLAVAHRNQAFGQQALFSASIELAGTQARLIPGITTPTQAKTLQPVWEPLTALLRGLERTGTDVIVDAGRAGAQYGPNPLLREADLTLLLTRTNLPAINATRARAATLTEDLIHNGTGADALALLLVGEGHPFSTRDVRQVTPVHIAGSVAWDPVAAEAFSLGTKPGRKLDSSPLIRSVRTAISAIHTLIIARRERLQPGALVREGGQHV